MSSPKLLSLNEGFMDYVQDVSYKSADEMTVSIKDLDLKLDVKYTLEHEDTMGTWLKIDIKDSYDNHLNADSIKWDEFFVQEESDVLLILCSKINPSYKLICNVCVYDCHYHQANIGTKF